MKLPGGDHAIVELDKLIHYALNPEHPRDKHKARVFAASLGLTRDNAEELQRMLLNAAATGDAELTISDEFGDRYVIDFNVDGPQGKGTVRSAWILRHGESSPRLTSCYVK
jgi:hypothetical protein